MEESKIKIEVEIDLQPLLDAITNSADLSDDRNIFEALAKVETLKRIFSEAKAQLDEVDKQVKATINGRAKALYGEEWAVIKGNNYKITRVKTGPVYEADDEADDEFLKLKVDVNSRKVEEYIKANSTLPKGVIYNPNRNESIRIAVSEEVA